MRCQTWFARICIFTLTAKVLLQTLFMLSCNLRKHRDSQFPESPIFHDSHDAVTTFSAQSSSDVITWTILKAALRKGTTMRTRGRVKPRSRTSLKRHGTTGWTKTQYFSMSENPESYSSSSSSAFSSFNFSEFFRTCFRALKDQIRIR